MNVTTVDLAFWRTATNPDFVTTELTKDDMLEVASQINLKLDSDAKKTKKSIFYAIQKFLTTKSGKEEKKWEEETKTKKSKTRKETTTKQKKSKSPKPKSKAEKTTCKVPAGWDSITMQYPSWEEIFRQLREDSSAKISGDLCDKECGGEGDCMFHVIAYIITLYIQKFGSEVEKQVLKQTSQHKLTQADVREMLANALTEADVDVKNSESLLNQYVSEQKGEWDLDWWRPDKIAAIQNSKERLVKLREIVKQPGMSFQGDHIALQVLQTLLTQMYGLGLVMMTDTGSFVCQNYKLQLHDPKIKYLAFFINIQGTHFKLAGFDSRVPGSQIQFIFPKNNLPETIKILLTDICDYQNQRTGIRRKERGENFDILVDVIQRPMKKQKT